MTFSFAFLRYVNKEKGERVFFCRLSLLSLRLFSKLILAKFSSSKHLLLESDSQLCSICLSFLHLNQNIYSRLQLIFMRYTQIDVRFRPTEPQI